MDYMLNFTNNFTYLFYESFSNDSFDNFTGQNDTTEFKLKHPVIGALLAFFSFVTITGNLLVIIAVFREMYLRTVTNYFIVSLAVADILVGGLVMPFSISLEMTNSIWLYGTAWCDLWHSFDVLGSTASILNLCVISLDRYWAITDPIAYPSKMSTGKVCMLITLVWLCSAGISFPAIAWWKAVTPIDFTGNQCLFTSDTGYLIFSSFVSFYCPLIIMLFVYFKIYRAARWQMRSLKHGAKIMSTNGTDGEVMTLRMHRGGANRRLMDDGYAFDKSASESEADSPSHVIHHHPHYRSSDEDQRPAKFLTKRLRQFAISKKLSKLAREQKAAKTLGIVVGVFILCWLPFFVANVLFGLCNTACVIYPDILFPVFTWLGYINSGMNPVIYALSMRDFRRAFAKILCMCCPKYRYVDRRKYKPSMSTSSFSVSCSEKCMAIKI